MVKFTGKVSDFLKIGAKAAARGDVELVREILKAKPHWIHHIGSHGRTLLWEASHKGKLPMVKYLIRRKADINACGGHYTPYFVEVSCLCIARFKKHHEVAEYLVSKGATYDIHSAAFLGDLASVKEFVIQDRKLIRSGHCQHAMAPRNDEGLEFVMEEAKWATPLCYALRGGDSDTVEFLIRKKSKINGFEKNLFIAANDCPEMVRLLLENGADPKFAPKASKSDKELFAVVSKFGVGSPSKKENSKELVYLCRGDRGGNPQEVRQLLAEGANVNHHDHKGKTALHRASKSGFLETMQILMDAGAIVDAKDNDQETPLFDVARSTIKKVANKAKAMEMLLKAGADHEHENCKGQTALVLAQRNKSPGAAKLARILKRS